MIISKLSPSLTRAFQDSEGPFPIEIMFGDVREYDELSKWEIANISEWELCTSISLIERQKDRRWRERTTPDRRCKKREEDEEQNLRDMLILRFPDRMNETTSELTDALISATPWDKLTPQ